MRMELSRTRRSRPLQPGKLQNSWRAHEAGAALDCGSREMASSDDGSKKSALWRPLQAYVLAAICFAIGLPVGYLFRGSAADQSTSVEAANTQASQPQMNAGKG